VCGLGQFSLAVFVRSASRAGIGERVERIERPPVFLVSDGWRLGFLIRYAKWCWFIEAPCLRRILSTCSFLMPLGMYTQSVKSRRGMLRGIRATWPSQEEEKEETCYALEWVKVPRAAVSILSRSKT